MNFYHKFLVLLVVVSVSVISGSPTKYVCYKPQQSNVCNVLNVNLDIKIDFNQRFSLIFKQLDYNRYAHDIYGRQYVKHELNFINSTLAYIPRSLFTALPPLTTLNVIGCGLVEISSYDFMNAANLRFLNLSHNALTALTYLAFNGAAELQEINLSHNGINRIEAGAFNNLNVLQKLDLSSNHVTTITKDIFATLNLLELNLKANRITAIDDTTFRSTSIINLQLDFNQLTEILLNFQKIETVSLNNNAIVTLTMTDDTNLKSLYADNNRIRNEFLTLSNNLNQLQKLSFANNSLSDINFIGTMIGLIYVDVSFNPVSSNHIESSTLLHLTNLEILYLAAINLHNLDFQLLSALQNLRILDVSHNNLPTLNSNGLKSLRNLKQLYINGNYLNQLDTAELDDLFLQLDLIDITDNDLQCHNMIEILEKFKQTNRKNAIDGNSKMIRSGTCQNHDLLDGAAQNNSNYYYMELNQIRGELGVMKKENENLKFQLANVMASHNASINAIHDYLGELAQQILVLNENTNENNSKTKLNLADLFDGAGNYSYSKSVRKDDGKIVNILIV